MDRGGKSVRYAMVTSGEAGIDGVAPDECRRVREAEQVESARIVGVDVVEFLGLPDGILEYGLALRRVICGSIRKHRPEIVITNNFRETWGGRSLNQADHIVTGRATVDAVSDAANRWIFPEQLAEGDLEPWRGVKEIWAANSPQADHGVDTSATFERGWPRWQHIRPTSQALAGSTSIQPSSWKGTPAKPAPVWACRWRRLSRSFRWAGATEGRPPLGCWRDWRC